MNSVQEQECAHTDFPSSFGQSSVQISLYSGHFCSVLLDSNGNITELVNNDGALVAHYEYSAYGEVIAMSGVEAENNSYLFSTKYFDKEFKKYGFGYRYLDPITGRWLSQDPIEELGGLNMYEFARNSSVNVYESYGLFGIGLGKIGGELAKEAAPDIIRNPLQRFRDFISVRPRYFDVGLETKCESSEINFHYKTRSAKFYSITKMGGAAMNVAKTLSLFTTSSQVITVNPIELFPEEYLSDWTIISYYHCVCPCAAPVISSYQDPLEAGTWEKSTVGSQGGEASLGAWVKSSMRYEATTTHYSMSCGNNIPKQEGSAIPYLLLL